MNFKDYLEDKRKGESEFLKSMETCDFKIIWMDERDVSSKKATKNPIIEDYISSVIFCDGKALLVSEVGSTKILGPERIEEIKKTFSL